MAIRWITHNSSHILFVSVQDCKTEPALYNLLEESARVIASEPEKVRLLCNLQGVTIEPGDINRVRMAFTNISQNKPEKSAIVVSGDRKCLLTNGFFRATSDENLRVLETMGEALNWLASVG